MTRFVKNLRFLLVALVLYGTSARLCASDAEPPLYLVLFRLAVGEDGKLQDLQTVKVIDLLSGSNNAVAVELPKAFLDHAKETVAAERSAPSSREQKPAGTLTSFLYAPSEGKPGASFAVLDGVMSSAVDFRLLGRDVAMSAFGVQSGHAAFFVSYYALAALPRATGEQRAAIVEAEVRRSAANLQDARILDRKDLSTASQTVVEVTCKSSENKALTLRARYICNDRQTLGFTAILPDGLSAEDAKSFDQLFDAFRFR